MQLIQLKNGRTETMNSGINKITQFKVTVQVGACQTTFATPLEINDTRYSYDYIVAEIMTAVAENVVLVKDYDLTTVEGACAFMGEFGYTCEDGARAVQNIIECAQAITETIPEEVIRKAVDMRSEGEEELIEAVKELPFVVIADESVAKIFNLAQNT